MYHIVIALLIITRALRCADSPPQITQPAPYRALARSKAGVAYTAIPCERAAYPERPNPDSVGVTLEHQAVARPQSHESADLAGDGDLSLAGDFCLRLH